MHLEAILESFDSSAFRTVAGGAALLGLIAGSVGAFSVLRRRSLQGDVVSHAALPGLAIAFLLGAREPVWLIVGGALAGWLSLSIVGIVTARSRIPFDAALAGSLAVFFGLGLVLMAHIQRNVPDAAHHPLDRYLFGQVALLRQADLNLIIILGAIILACLLLFWKELKLISFDPDYAVSIGYPRHLLDLLLTTLTVVAVVVGLRAVGVVLMTALLVAPAIAARQWTNQLGKVVVLAGLFGSASGSLGTLVGHLAGQGVPTGPTIVLSATMIVAISLLFGGARGAFRNPQDSKLPVFFQNKIIDR